MMIVWTDFRLNFFAALLFAHAEGAFEQLLSFVPMCIIGYDRGPPRMRESFAVCGGLGQGRATPIYI